jgi:hypothetical protein
VQEGGVAQCYVNAPATGLYAISITSTCVEMTISDDDGKVLKSSLTVKSSRAQNIASLGA